MDAVADLIDAVANAFPESKDRKKGGGAFSTKRKRKSDKSKFLKRIFSRKRKASPLRRALSALRCKK
jgi:hypothetical protein